MFLQLPKIFNSFSKKERIVFIAAFFIFLVTSFLWIIRFSETHTLLAPVDSGEYTEGAIGQPVFVNPVIASNSGPDNDLNQLIFADMKNLIETYGVSDDKRVWNIRIKGDVIWQDNQPLTTDDVIFTIKAIQDPDTNSPLYSSWKGVKVERTSEREIKIVLPNPYAYFENNLLDLKPIPKHLFSGIPFAHMKLSTYNIEPVSSGPFKFISFEKRRDGFITKFILERNDSFPGDKPHLDKFSFRFYPNEEEMIKAFNSGEIDGFSPADYKNLSKIYIPHKVFKIVMPRYYAVFFEPQNNVLLKDKGLRAALNYATDKAKIVKTIFKDAAIPIDGPLLFQNHDYDPSVDFSMEKAGAILDELGWTVNPDGVREIKEKLSLKKLEFGLTVYPTPFLTETAKIIKDDWAKIGVKINLNFPAPADFEEDIIKPRNYEMLLFGNIYGKNLDPFSFWHSSQKFHPGLNLSLYENKNADFLIEIIRTDFDPNKRQEELKELQKIINADTPAVFLYSPHYIYVSSKTLRGFEQNYLSLPGDRFSNIKDWYVRTVRIFKK